MDETFEIIITPEAEEDLENLINYLLLNESWQTAQKVRLALLGEIQFLSKMPTANGIVQSISDEQLIYRRRLKWQYRIIFLVEQDEKIVFVVGIDSTKQNPENILERFKE